MKKLPISKAIKNKAGYTAEQSRAIGTDRPTDMVSYRVACTRLKIVCPNIPWYCLVCILSVLFQLWKWGDSVSKPTVRLFGGSGCKGFTRGAAQQPESKEKSIGNMPLVKTHYIDQNLYSIMIVNQLTALHSQCIMYIIHRQLTRTHIWSYTLRKWPEEARRRPWSETSPPADAVAAGSAAVAMGVVTALLVGKEEVSTTGVFAAASAVGEGAAAAGTTTVAAGVLLTNLGKAELPRVVSVLVAIVSKISLALFKF